MKTSTWAALAAAALATSIAVAACVIRPDLAIETGTGSISQTLCDEVFVTGLDPDRAFAEDIRPNPGMRVLLPRLHYTVDRLHHRVETAWAGHFAQIATYRPDTGCQLRHGPGATPPTAPVAAPAPPAGPSPAPILPDSGPLRDAVDRAFAEHTQPPYRHVRAIVVMRDGQIVAERYAPGIGPDTPLLSYSVSKSVIDAFVGILVRQGKLDLYAPAPVPAWQSPADPRHAITLDQLLRMTSGLNAPETDTGFDLVSRMLFLQPEMAAYAERAALSHPPGTVWDYTSANTLIASSIVRDAVGGHRADVARFAQTELFGPAGMQHTLIEFDDAGTPIGSTRIFASARDWARFGQVYLDGGMAGSRRILPSGWTGYVARPTLNSDYGSGFWVNAGTAPHARGRVSAGMPVDAYYASGNLGQRVVIVPSHRLVIVRFGATVQPDDFDIAGLVRLVADVVAIPPP